MEVNGLQIAFYVDFNIFVSCWSCDLADLVHKLESDLQHLLIFPLSIKIDNVYVISEHLSDLFIYWPDMYLSQL